MSSRQARRERRDAERKAKKTELKRLKAEGLNAPPSLGAVHPVEDAEPAPQVSAEQMAVLERIEKRYQQKRAETNRANAKSSTGPRTEAGKLASSRNSLKHGLASSKLLIPGEDPEEFEALLHDLLAEHQPTNATEELLIKEMAQSWWLAQRAIRLQNECFFESGLDEKGLALFLRYQTTQARAFHKALNTLLRLQKERRASKTGFVSQKTASAPTANGFVSQQDLSAPLDADLTPQNLPLAGENPPPRLQSSAA